MKRNKLYYDKNLILHITIGLFVIFILKILIEQNFTSPVKCKKIEKVLAFLILLHFTKIPSCIWRDSSLKSNTLVEV